MSITTVSVVVPDKGDGPASDVSSIVGTKTVQLSGTFDGYYDLLASQDDTTFVPVASFDAGGPEGIKLTVEGAFSSVKLRSSAVPTSAVTCEVSGVYGPGQNGFAVVASLPPGFSGQTPALDLGTVVAPTGPEADACLLCRGSFEDGPITVLGSLDGSEWNPVGEFRAGRRATGATSALEMSPLLVAAKLRYVRLQVDAFVAGSVVVTVGGSAPSSGDAGENLAVVASSTLGNHFFRGSPAGDAYPLTDVLGNSVTLENQFGSVEVLGTNNTVSGGQLLVLGHDNTVGPHNFNSTAVGVHNRIGSSVNNGLALGSECVIPDSSPQSSAVGYQVRVGGANSVGVGNFITIDENSNATINGVFGEVVTLAAGNRFVYALGSQISSGTSGDHCILIGTSLTTLDSCLESALAGSDLNLGAGCNYDFVAGLHVTLADRAGRNIVVNVGPEEEPVSVEGNWNIILRTRSSLAIADSVACVIIGADAYAVNNSVALGTGAMVLGAGNSNVALGNTATIGQNLATDTVQSCAIIDSTIGFAGVADFSGMVSHVGDDCHSCLALVSSGVAFGGSGTSYSAAIVSSFVGSASTYCLAMVGGTVPDTSFNCLAIGSQSLTGTVASFAIGSQASAASNQMVVGASVLNCNVDQLIVRGFLADGTTPVVVLSATSEPAAGEAGLAVTFNDGAAVTSRTVKGASTPPVGAILLYVDP